MNQMPTDHALIGLPDLVLARSTMHLSGGLVPGGWYWVDPSSEYVQMCFEHGYLVADVEDEPTEAQEPPQDAEIPSPDDVAADTVPDGTEAYSASEEFVDLMDRGCAEVAEWGRTHPGVYDPGENGAA